MYNNYVSLTEDGKLCQPYESTFPILKQLDNDAWQLIGTAFFIAKDGVFLTAKHVLLDVLDKNKNQIHPIAAFLFPRNGICQIRPITKGFLTLNGDLAAGVIINLENPFYKISRKTLKIGEEIFTFAYPETVVNSYNNIIVRGNFYEGIITQIYPEGRDRCMLPNPCYETNINILGGASGGPVFNKEGCIVGINSSAFVGNDSPVSFISDINGVFT